MNTIRTPETPPDLAVGDHVRRGRGKTQWQITDISEHFISLRSLADGWTKASVTHDKAHTLTRIDHDDTLTAPLRVPVGHRP